MLTNFQHPTQDELQSQHSLDFSEASSCGSEDNIKISFHINFLEHATMEATNLLETAKAGLETAGGKFLENASREALELGARLAQPLPHSETQRPFGNANIGARLSQQHQASRMSCAFPDDSKCIFEPSPCNPYPDVFIAVEDKGYHGGRIFPKKRSSDIVEVGKSCEDLLMATECIEYIEEDHRRPSSLELHDENRISGSSLAINIDKNTGFSFTGSLNFLSKSLDDQLDFYILKNVFKYHLTVEKAYYEADWKQFKKEMAEKNTVVTKTNDSTALSKLRDRLPGRLKRKSQQGVKPSAEYLKQQSNSRNYISNPRSLSELTIRQQTSFRRKLFSKKIGSQNNNKGIPSLVASKQFPLAQRQRRTGQTSQQNKDILSPSPSLPNKDILSPSPSLPNKDILSPSPSLPNKDILSPSPSLPNKDILSPKTSGTSLRSLPSPPSAGSFFPKRSFVSPRPSNYKSMMSFTVSADDLTGLCNACYKLCEMRVKKREGRSRVKRLVSIFNKLAQSQHHAGKLFKCF